MREAIGDQGGDFGQRFAGNQLVAELARDRDRDVGGFGPHPGFAAGEARCDALDRDPDLFERQRGAAVAFRRRLARRRVVAVAIGAGLGGRDLLRDLGSRGGLLARLVGHSEVHVEQEFCGCGHQYTSSSSARFLVSVISPLAAMSLARLTSSACASATSRSRTGPIAAMSSISILPPRDDMVPRKKRATSPVAPVIPMPRLAVPIL